MIQLLLALSPLPKPELVEFPLGGFATSNVYNGSWTEDELYEQLSQIGFMGYARYGYEYFVLDSAWVLPERDAQAQLRLDESRFAHGFGTFVQMVRQAGLKFGVTTTIGGLSGSLGHEDDDARMLAKLGVDYVRYEDLSSPLDNQMYAPNIVNISVAGKTYGAHEAKLEGAATLIDDNQISGIGLSDGAALFEVDSPDSADYDLEIAYLQENEARVLQIVVNNRTAAEALTERTDSMDVGQAKMALFKIALGRGSNEIRVQMNLTDAELLEYCYVRMANALAASRAGIVFDVSARGAKNSAQWGPRIGHLWRISPDVALGRQQCSFASVVETLEEGLEFAEATGPNSYIDADLLCVGMDEVSLEETRFHLTALAALDAPFFLSTDLRRINVTSNILLTNSQLSAITHDRLYKQARLVQKSGNFIVLLKELSGSRVAIFMLNKQTFDQTLRFDLRTIQQHVSGGAWSSAEQVKAEDVWGQNQRFYNVEEDKYVSSVVPAHDAALWILQKYW